MVILVLHQPQKLKRDVGASSAAKKKRKIAKQKQNEQCHNFGVNRKSQAGLPASWTVGCLKIMGTSWQNPLRPRIWPLDVLMKSLVEPPTSWAAGRFWGIGVPSQMVVSLLVSLQKHQKQTPSPQLVTENCDSPLFL